MVTAATVLVSYIISESRENAANGRMYEPSPERADVLDALDPQEYPFIRSVAEQLRVHDDRDEFLAGIDLILAGIEASL